MQTYTAQQLLQQDHEPLVEETSLLIASSFTNDPGTLYVFNNLTDDQYINAIRSYFRYLVRACLLSDCTVTVMKRDPSQAQSESQQPSATWTISAAAITLPPGGIKKFTAPSTAIRAGFWGTVIKCGLSPWCRIFTQILPQMDQAKSTIFRKDQQATFWMVMFLASHPDSQGVGLGKKLLKEVQRQVVQRSQGKVDLLLYLESSSRGSQKLCRRVGFEDRFEMKYGQLKDGEGFTYNERGKVVGGKMFAMLWTL